MQIKPRVVVIGGSGVHDSPLFEGLKWKTLEIEIEFPGLPGNGIVWYQETDDVVFIPRHGHGKERYGPSVTQYAANIVAARKLGSVVIATSAVGSLQEAIQVESLVIPNDYVDESGRNDNLWGTEIVTHVNPRTAFSEDLRTILIEEAGDSFQDVVDSATVVTIPGDRFGTTAEGKKRAQYADIVGMTCNPEAQMAQQLGLPYALAAFVVDNDSNANHEGGTLEVMTRLSQPERVPAYIKRAVAKAQPLAQNPPTLDAQLKGNIIDINREVITNTYLKEVADHLVKTYC